MRVYMYGLENTMHEQVADILRDHAAIIRGSDTIRRREQPSIRRVRDARTRGADRLTHHTLHRGV